MADKNILEEGEAQPRSRQPLAFSGNTIGELLTYEGGVIIAKVEPEKMNDFVKAKLLSIEFKAHKTDPNQFIFMPENLDD